LTDQATVQATPFRERRSVVRWCSCPRRQTQSLARQKNWYCAYSTSSS